MKKFYRQNPNCFLLLSILLFVGNDVLARGGEDSLRFAKINRQAETGNPPGKIMFRENKGQVHDQNYLPRPDILYSGEANGMAFHLSKSGISYQLMRVDKYEVVPAFKRRDSIQVAKDISLYRIDLEWIGASERVNVVPEEKQEGSENFYFANCPEGALDAKSYGRLTYEGIYQGIDLVWYQHNGDLKYDFIVHPNSDYKSIKIKVKGALPSILENGDLELETPFGKVLEGKPLVFQNGIALPARWNLKGNELSFVVEGYDNTQKMIIDPITRYWGTYYGGTLDDQINATSLDRQGNIYVAGTSESSNGTTIATNGAHQSTYGGGSVDAFLAKFNTNGVRLWATYYGGSSNDRGHGCATDSIGSIYLVGETASTSAISTPGAHQATHAGAYDGFIVKFDATTGVRAWGTYYGSTGGEPIYACATNPAGELYVFGNAPASVGNSIATSGSHQATNGGWKDAFIAKFNANGTRQWGTYFGGTGDEDAAGITVAPNGNILLAGTTGSTNGTTIATAGSHQPTFGGVSSQDAFLACFSPAGVRIWSTYYGGTGQDNGHDCEADALGNFYLVGTTSSTASIATTGSHRSTFGGTDDGFIAKFNALGVRQFGTYYGGTSAEQIYGSAMSRNNELLITGTAGNSFGSEISTIGAFQYDWIGVLDCYFALFNSNGSRLRGSFYGTAALEYAMDCAIDSAGKIFISGYQAQNVTNGLATAGSHQPVRGGGTYDGFIAKFDPDGCAAAPNQPATITGVTTTCSNTVLSYSVTNDISATGYTWSLPPGWTGSSTTNTITVTTGSSGGTISVTANNLCGSSTAQTLPVTVNTAPSQPGTISGNATVCDVSTNTYTITAVPGAVSYTWTLPGGWSGSSSTNSISTVAGSSGGTISVTASNTCGTSTAQTLVATVNPIPTAAFNFSTNLLAVTFGDLSGGANGWFWTFGDGNSSSVQNPTHSYANAGSYSVCLIASNAGCSDTICDSVEVISVAVEGKENASIAVFPNPSNGIFRIESDQQLEGQVIDALGKVVLAFGLDGNGELDLSGFSDGIYSLQLWGLDSKFSFQLVKVGKQ